MTTTSPETSKIRQVRVPDSLWRPACQKAYDDGLKIGDVIRTLLRRYVDGEITL